MNDIQLCLLAAKTLISDPADWTVGCLARDRSGRPTMPCQRRARRWCSIGALNAAGAPWPVLAEAAGVFVLLPSDRGVHDLGWPHAEVMALFDRAIEAAA